MSVWAYAKAGIWCPCLFETVADIVVERDCLDDFEPQSISNIVWAFATAEESYNHLFNKLACEATARDLDTFGEQELKDMV